MAKLPQKVKIGPTTYTLSFMSKDQADAGVYGRTDPKADTIVINPSLCLGEQQTTVLHEVLHAIFLTSNLTHVLDLDEKKEEQVIRMLEPFLLSLIRDNPKLMEYLKQNG